MKDSDWYNTEALAEILRLDYKSVPWHAMDFAALFRHQLITPLVDDMAEARRMGISGVSLGVRRSTHARVTLKQLMQESNPSIDALRCIKALAKSRCGERGGGLPREIAMATYYLAIALAIVRADQAISTLSDANLERGLQWALDQSWIDEQSHAILNEAYQRVSAKAKSA